MGSKKQSEFDLNQRIQDVARKIIEQDDDILAVMIRGSYFKKTMTTTSDVDLYAVTRTKGPSGEFLQHEGTLFHIRFLPFTYLQMELRRCEPRYLGFIFHGRPVIDPSGIFTALQAVVESLPTKETLQRLPSEGKHQEEDAYGQLKAGNSQTAIYLARTAAHSYMQTLLFANNIPCFKRKDVINDMNKLKGFEQAKNLYLSIMGLDNVASKKAKQIIEEVEQLFNILEQSVQDRYGYGVIENPPSCW